MTAWIEGDRSFFMGARASLVEEDREVAGSWASKHINHNPAYSFVLGRFVESDRANGNRQLFSLKGLQMAQPTIQHAPMNMNHSARRIVGSFVASELLYPTASEDEAEMEPLREAAMAANSTLNPYIESLGVMWRHYFPDEYMEISKAHQEGALYFSMEAIPSHVQCVGNGGCEETFEYAGRTSPTYCEHINKTMSDKFLINPHFTAGAIIVPPVKPGWANADIHSLVAQHAELADEVFEHVKAELPHLSTSEWEGLMGELLVLATVDSRI